MTYDPGPSREPRYAPDMDGLWLLYQDVASTGNRLERMAHWRIPADDWARIRLRSPGELGHAWHPVEPPRPPDMQWRLFGLRVEVAPAGEGFPELVLTMDRRTA